MAKIEIKIFSSFHVDKLYRQVASLENFEPYVQESFPFEDYFAKGPSGIFIEKDLKLDAEKSDLENSIILYEALSGLTETQASDERLWVTLIHSQFWSYARGRWPIENAKVPISRIRGRYFLRSLSLGSLTRNLLARLWWYAHIAIDTNRENKYELLEILLQKQDLVVGITERAIGTNKNLRIGILEYLQENPLIASDENKRRELFKGLNLWGGVTMLPFLEIPDIKLVLKNIASSIEA